MMSLIEEKAIEIGLEELFLKVLPDNERAIRLYRKRRFLEYKRDERFIWMNKFL